MRVAGRHWRLLNEQALSENAVVCVIVTLLGRPSAREHRPRPGRPPSSPPPPRTRPVPLASMSDLHRPPVPDPVVDSLRALVDPSLLPPDPAAAHIRAGALFARLKALNRAANGATRAQKQATADARQQMDHTYLGLQNLLYEKRHLEREIEKCRQFACVDDMYLSARAI